MACEAFQVNYNNALMLINQKQYELNEVMEEVSQRQWALAAAYAQAAMALTLLNGCLQQQGGPPMPKMQSSEGPKLIEWIQSDAQKLKNK